MKNIINDQAYEGKLSELRAELEKFIEN
jgi:hypothetical protein